MIPKNVIALTIWTENQESIILLRINKMGQRRVSTIYINNTNFKHHGAAYRTSPGHSDSIWNFVIGFALRIVNVWHEPCHPHQLPDGSPLRCSQWAS